MSAEVESANGTELPDGPPSHDGRAESRLLEPVATVIRGAYRLSLVGIVAGAVGPLVGTKLHMQWGGPDVCAESRSDFGTDGFTGVFRPHAGVEVMARPSYCTDHADSAQRLFDFLGGFPSWLLVLGVLFLLNRLIGGASRHGVFTARTAKHLQIAGWWLLCGCLVAEVVEAGAHAALLATLAQEYTFDAGTWLGSLQLPYALVFTALGILTFARIMRAGVTMREDLEGTV
ncbi:DUF2975 domain-containing protein [Streptomyces sp. NBC_00316]|uniref:DUF2975 domain-containing protein n=1 Tax=Streptomyces sp. NBC_00316 TaxID=2975710 RepID=UPI002E2B9108|nr:DUF2975 domain-containing protein [Streptomyces sp. NBC_00316]